VKRILVDLRVYLATVAVLGVALALVGLAFAGVYNAPIEHMVSFQGGAIARVVNYSTIVTQQNLTELGIPSGATFGFDWYYGNAGAVTIFAYTGPNPAATNAVVCTEGPATSGSCAWTANGQSYTVSIAQAISIPALPFSSANYTAEVNIQGWYAYSTPAH
jgi:hypothetical protein